MRGGRHTCVVLGCSNRKSTTKMFSFPNPKYGLDRFKEWIRLAKNPNFANLTIEQIHKKGNKICARHFLEEDIIDFPSRRVLRPTAVPVLNLPPDTSDDATLGQQLGDFTHTTNSQMLDFNGIDMATDDFGPQLVDSELLRGLALYDAKLINFDDFKDSLYDPHYDTRPFIIGTSNQNDYSQKSDSNENHTEIISNVSEQNNIAVDDCDENRNFDEDEVDEQFEVRADREGNNHENINETKSSIIIEKPYFKSVKCYVSDCNKFTEVCRICFRSLTKEEEVKLYGEESSVQDQTQLKNMLKLVLPDLDLEMYPNTTICAKCTELLSYSYQLKELWLSTEAKLQRILEKQKSVINRDADLVIVKKERKDQDLPGIDHDYANTALNKKNETDEELKMTDSILEKLFTSNSPKNVKVFHGELNMNNLITKSFHAPPPIIRKSRKGGPCTCEQCGHISAHPYLLRRHLLTHSSKKRTKLMCEICGELFATYKSLRTHYRIHTESNCSICGKEFNRLQNLKTHMRVTHGHKSFQCDYCGKQFKYAVSLRQHLHWHNPKTTSSTVHTCNICDRSFCRASTLRRHLSTHLIERPERPWKCKYCGRCFKHEDYLEEHIKIYHMNQGKFVCQYCDKPFSKKINLRKHVIRIHCWSHEDQKFQLTLKNEAERPWKCKDCGRCVKHESSLRKHIRIYHMKQGKHVCQYCDKPLSNRKNLLNHGRRIHGLPYEVQKVQQDTLLENETDFFSSAGISTVECEV